MFGSGRRLLRSFWQRSKMLYIIIFHSIVTFTLLLSIVHRDSKDTDPKIIIEITLLLLYNRLNSNPSITNFSDANHFFPLS